MRPLKFIVGFASFSLTLLISPAWGQEVSNSQSQETSLTLYDNRAFVVDRRTVKFTEGANSLRFEDVSTLLKPETVSFQSPGNVVSVKEQNYQRGYFDTDFLFGRTAAENSDMSFKYLKHGGVVELSANLPSGFLTRPSLLLKLVAKKAGEQKIELAYQTTGISRHFNYVAVVNKDFTQCDLTGWGTISNKSGVTYKNADLKLASGDIRSSGAFDNPVSNGADSDSSTQNQILSVRCVPEDRTDLLNGETKQVNLYSALNIPMKKVYVFEPARQTAYEKQLKDKADIQVKAELISEQKLSGMMLPAGSVCVYQKNADGDMSVLRGEDKIGFTPGGMPKKRPIRFFLYGASDLSAERKQTSREEKVGERLADKAGYEVTVSNKKKESVTVVYTDHLSSDGDIITSSQSYTKVEPRTFEFAIKVPANGEAKITYEIERGR